MTMRLCTLLLLLPLSHRWFRLPPPTLLLVSCCVVVVVVVASPLLQLLPLRSPWLPSWLPSSSSSSSLAALFLWMCCLCLLSSLSFLLMY